MTVYRIPRDPLKFDAFDLLARFSHERKVPLRDPKTLEDLFEQIKDKVPKSVDNPTFLFGQRTESMFEGVVVSLGHVRMIRREDVGDLFVSDENLKVPDFHLVLDDGSRLLVEVKNHHPENNPIKDYVCQSRYMNGLRSYAELMKCPLAIAIYWTRLKLWTLVPDAAFAEVNGKYVASFETSMKTNMMARLGDLWIGTKAPLRARIVADPTQSRTIDDNGEVHFIIGDIQLFCGDKMITNKIERNIALRLMLFGNWVEDDPVPIVSSGEIEAVEFLSHPEEPTGQGFEMIGSLSEMFSRYYLYQTSESEAVDQTRANFTPGSFGQLIPDDYKGNALPIWRFELESSLE